MQIVISPIDPNTVNPVVPAWQAPTVNVHTGCIEPPNRPLPPAPPALDPLTGNMRRAEVGNPQGGPEPAFPNPPAVLTDRGLLVSPN